MCPEHTAKPQIHTAKPLPCVAHGKGHTANRRRQRRPLPCASCRAHGKGFSVCTFGTQQKFSEKLKKIRVCHSYHTGGRRGPHLKPAAHAAAAVLPAAGTPPPAPRRASAAFPTPPHLRPPPPRRRPTCGKKGDARERERT